jgi:hypothetical protein
MKMLFGDVGQIFVDMENKFLGGIRLLGVGNWHFERLK